jgi:RNA polymerase sigma-70 factor (ECF subfamily)
MPRSLTMPCPADLSDEQLAERVQTGCAESFAELDRRFRPRLLHVLLRRLSTREDAEDVVQQTLFRVFEKIHLYDPRQRLSPWVFTIGLRLAAQHGRRKQLPVNQETDRPLDLTCPTLGPEQQLSRREERDSLWEVADRVLKPEQWTALWLFYGEEQSIKEVAQSLGRTKTSVSVLLFRARRTLLPHLKQFAVAEHEESSPADEELPAALLVGQCSEGLACQLSGGDHS